MKKNMGSIDRAMRVTLAIVMLYFVQSQAIEGWTKYILLLLAGVFIITSFVSFCPMYSIFGINTCSIKSSKQ